MLLNKFNKSLLREVFLTLYCHKQHAIGRCYVYEWCKNTKLCLKIDVKQLILFDNL